MQSSLDAIFTFSSRQQQSSPLAKALIRIPCTMACSVCHPPSNPIKFVSSLYYIISLTFINLTLLFIILTRDFFNSFFFVLLEINIKSHEKKLLNIVHGKKIESSSHWKQKKKFPGSSGTLVAVVAGEICLHNVSCVSCLIRIYTARPGVFHIQGPLSQKLFLLMRLLSASLNYYKRPLLVLYYYTYIRYYTSFTSKPTSSPFFINNIFLLSTVVVDKNKQFFCLTRSLIRYSHVRGTKLVVVVVFPFWWR